MLSKKDKKKKVSHPTINDSLHLHVCNITFSSFVMFVLSSFLSFFLLHKWNIIIIHDYVWSVDLPFCQFDAQFGDNISTRSLHDPCDIVVIHSNSFEKHIEEDMFMTDDFNFRVVEFCMTWCMCVHHTLYNNKTNQKCYC